MPRISYVPVEQLEDQDLRELLEHAARNGTPRPEIQAIRAHVPALLRAFAATWERLFRTGNLDHSVKELCRVYVSRTLDCHY